MIDKLLPNEQAGNEESHVSDAHVSYKPKLVPVLLREHQALISLYKDIVAIEKQGQSNLSESKLTKFYDIFSGHLIKKRLALYPYTNNLCNDADASECVSSIKSEMYRIGKELHVLLSQHKKNQRVITENFIKKFEVLGQALSKQLSIEEKHLFPVYQAACLTKF